MHRFLSGSRAQENDDVTRSPFRDSGAGETDGGMQVASVKRSTSLRIKYFGNVPPRLDTLHQLVMIGWGHRRTYVANMVM